LRHEAQLAPEVLQVERAHVLPVDEHLSRHRVVKALDQRDDRALPAPRRPDQRHRLPGLDRDVDAGEDVDFPRRVPEHDVLELDAALDACRLVAVLALGVDGGNTVDQLEDGKHRRLRLGNVRRQRSSLPRAHPHERHREKDLQHVVERVSVVLHKVCAAGKAAEVEEEDGEERKPLPHARHECSVPHAAAVEGDGGVVELGHLVFRREGCHRPDRRHRLIGHAACECVRLVALSPSSLDELDLEILAGDHEGEGGEADEREHPPADEGDDEGDGEEDQVLDREAYRGTDSTLNVGCLLGQLVCDDPRLVFLVVEEAYLLPQHCREGDLAEPPREVLGHEGERVDLEDVRNESPRGQANEAQRVLGHRLLHVVEAHVCSSVVPQRQHRIRVAQRDVLDADILLDVVPVARRGEPGVSDIAPAARARAVGGVGIEGHGLRDPARRQVFDALEVGGEHLDEQQRQHRKQRPVHRGPEERGRNVCPLWPVDPQRAHEEPFPLLLRRLLALALLLFLRLLAPI